MKDFENGRGFWHSRIDIWAPATVGAVMLGYLLYRADHNQQPNGLQVHIYLTLLALAAAAFAAMIPGFLDVGLTTKGVAIRAAGAMGVFVLVYFYEPAHSSIASSIGIDLHPPSTATTAEIRHSAPSEQSTGYFSVGNGDKFVRDGNAWREDPAYDGVNHFKFEEYSRSNSEIILIDKGRAMYLRLPLPAGTAQWKNFNSSDWVDWFPVTFHAENK